MSIALILTVCTALVGGAEDCSQVDTVKVYDQQPTIKENLDLCTWDMTDNKQTKSDRYLACTNVNSRYLIKRNDNRSVKQILADLNRD